MLSQKRFPFLNLLVRMVRWQNAAVIPLDTVSVKWNANSDVQLEQHKRSLINCSDEAEGDNKHALACFWIGQLSIVWDDITLQQKLNQTSLAIFKEQQ